MSNLSSLLLFLIGILIIKMEKVLTEEMLIYKAKTCHLNLVENLNLWGSELGNVSAISLVSNVQILSLAVNKIKSLEPF